MRSTGGTPPPPLSSSSPAILPLPTCCSQLRSLTPRHLVYTPQLFTQITFTVEVQLRSVPYQAPWPHPQPVPAQAQADSSLLTIRNRPKASLLSLVLRLLQRCIGSGLQASRRCRSMVRSQTMVPLHWGLPATQRESLITSYPLRHPVLCGVVRSRAI